MWKDVKQISLSHPNEVVRAYAKHLLAKMNSGKRREARKEILFFIKNHKHECTSIS
jgi:hypothetical protein